MCVINNLHSILDEDNSTSDVMPVTRSFSVMFEEPFTLRGDCSRYDAITMSAKRIINGGDELFMDNFVGYNFE